MPSSDLFCQNVDNPRFVRFSVEILFDGTIETMMRTAPGKFRIRFFCFFDVSIEGRTSTAVVDFPASTFLSQVFFAIVGFNGARG